MDDVSIYHNPACGTSRNVLALLRHAGLEPRVIEYLNTPPSRTELAQLVERMGVALRTVVRERARRSSTSVSTGLTSAMTSCSMR